MRLSASFGAIVATGLLSQAAAQAIDYGSPDGPPSGNPSGGSDNAPAGNPNGASGSIPGPIPSNGAPEGVPGSAPGSIPAGSLPGSVPNNGPGGIPGNTPNSPGSNPGGLPSSVPGGIPGGGPLPAGFPSSVLPGGVSGGPPSTVGGVPNGSPGRVPGGAVPNAPPCTLQSTTTVFITVYPTSAPSSSDGSLDGSSPAGSIPNGSGGSPGGSSPAGSTPNGSGGSPGGSSPAGSIPNGSGGSPGGSSPAGSPDDSAPAGTLPNGSASGSTLPDGSSNNSPPNDSPADGTLPDDSGSGQTVVNNPNATPPPTFSASSAKAAVSPFTTLTVDIWGPSDDGTDAGDDSDTNDGSNAGGGADSGDGSGTAISAPVPAPQYTGSGDSSNASPGNQPGGAPDGSGANTQASVPKASQTIGSGRPASIPHNQPSRVPPSSGQQASGSLPVTTGAGPQAPGNSGSGIGHAYVTVTGADGLPTVYPAGGDLSPSYVTITGADGLPTVYPASNDLSPTCVTITGADGLPTVFPGGNSGSPPFVTITGPDGLPTVISGGGSLPQGQGQPIPTAGVIPQPSGQGFPQGMSTTLPFPPSSGSALPGGFVPQGSPDGSDSVPPGGAPAEGITTCTTFTFIGPDGKPTAVDSTWVIPFSTPVFDASAASAALPAPANTLGSLSGIPIDVSGSIPTGGFPAPGSPLDAPGGPGATTCTSWTVTGTDGLPTVTHSTWVIPSATPTGGAPADHPGPILTQGSLPGFPSAGPAGFPNGAPVASGALGAVTTCTSYTYTGADGLPTVVDSTWVIPGPANTLSGLPGSPNGPFEASGALPNGFPSAIITQANPSPGSAGPTGAGVPGDSLVTTCTSYTILGPDGLPTVVDSTWVIPAAANTQTALPGSPSSNGPAGPFGPGGPVGPAGVPGGAGVTTCTSYTVIGTDGLPTIVDSTWVIPAAVGTQSGLPGNPSFVSNALPGQTTGAPGFPSPGASVGAGDVTTCTSFTLIGTDGLPTVVDSTWVIPVGNGGPTGTTFGIPSAFPQPSMTGVPQSAASDGSAAGTATILTTAIIIGPNGQPTPVVQTVVVESPNGGPQGTIAGVPAPPPSGPLVSGSIPSGYPSLAEYGPSLPSAVISGSSAAAFSGAGGIFDSGTVTGTVTGTLTSTFTKVVNPTGGPVVSGGTGGPLPSYDDPWGNGGPIPGSPQNPDSGYGAVPSEVTLWPASSAAYGPVPAPGASTLLTSTWANVITEQTTSYTINFPLTTLATVTLPAVKRVLRRQETSAELSSTWTNSSSAISETLSENTSLGASLSSALSTENTMSTALPTLSVSNSGSSATEGESTTASVLASTSESASASATPSICPAGGRIGNTTLDFDSDKPGPLFNPKEDVWFSQGFLIAPPSSKQPLPYIPSSGGQLVEFVPPALSNTTTSGSGDVAQIGVGPNAANSCFNFDFLGASLGCDAQSNEQWCEFEISAYRYNTTTKREESIAWSETKRVPACPTSATGGCQLTQVELNGYTNITSVLITLRVGLELRVWWADDIRVGWSDNSCKAATCRAGVPARRVKRERVEWALRKGIWHWGQSGLQRLDDEVVWDSLN